MLTNPNFPLEVILMMIEELRRAEQELAQLFYNEDFYNSTRKREALKAEIACYKEYVQ